MSRLQDLYKIWWTLLLWFLFKCSIVTLVLKIQGCIFALPIKKHTFSGHWFLFQWWVSGWVFLTQVFILSNMAVQFLLFAASHGWKFFIDRSNTYKIMSFHPDDFHHSSLFSNKNFLTQWKILFVSSNEKARQGIQSRQI